jgi:hypothetical protein
MKKITKTILILAIATVAIMPVKTFALGTESEKIINSRISTLEAQVADLQSQNRNLIASINQKMVIENSDTRILLLENRMTILEKTVNFIVNQVSNTLAEIIKFLTK